MNIPERYMKFVRFCLVGGCAALVHYGIFCGVLIAMGVDVSWQSWQGVRLSFVPSSPLELKLNLAYVCGYLISFVGNFFATSYFTFRQTPSWGRFAGFAGSHAINFLLHIVLLNFFLWLGLHPLIAPFAVMAVAMLVQYAILNIVFKDYSKPCGGKVMLSFDTEEFDVPKEHNVPFSLEEGMVVSRYGTNRILDCLAECGVHATFFCTTNFAKNAPDIVERIMREGHEVAAHGCDHWSPRPEDVAESKRVLEALTGRTILGYRQPRMFPVDGKEQVRQGYVYNASINPACIPGRYIHLTTPRTTFFEQELLQIPASVSPWFRIPLFWLALHNFPLWFYKALVHRVLRHDGYFNTYFHPWEFYALGEHPEWKMPFIIRNHAGEPMYERLKAVIEDLKQQGCEFITYGDYAQQYMAEHTHNLSKSV